MPQAGNPNSRDDTMCCAGFNAQTLIASLHFLHIQFPVLKYRGLLFDWKKHLDERLRGSDKIILAKDHLHIFSAPRERFNT